MGNRWGYERGWPMTDNIIRIADKLAYPYEIPLYFEQHINEPIVHDLVVEITRALDKWWKTPEQSKTEIGALSLMAYLRKADDKFALLLPRVGHILDPMHINVIKAVELAAQHTMMEKRRERRTWLPPRIAQDNNTVVGGGWHPISAIRDFQNGSSSNFWNRPAASTNPNYDNIDSFADKLTPNARWERIASSHAKTRPRRRTKRHRNKLKK